MIGLVFVGHQRYCRGRVIFAIPGLGSTAVQATAAHDFPVIQGVVVYFTLIVIAVNLLIDLAYGYFNPKVRAHDRTICPDRVGADPPSTVRPALTGSETLLRQPRGAAAAAISW